MPTTQKAYIETERKEQIPCLFNPSEFSLSMANTWSSKPVAGRSVPELTFTGGQSGTLNLNLVFDTTGDGSPVTKYTNKLVGLMKVDAELPGFNRDQNKGRPQHVTFRWGDIHSFKAVITRLDLTFTYFSSSGVPLRAKASLSLTQIEDDATWGPQNPTSGTPAPHRIHRLQPGETLDRLAARYYGDSTRWRPIAQANAVVDPLGLEPGTLLVIPKQTGQRNG